MKSRLIRVFDNNYNFLNVVIPLTIDFDEVIYIYHHDIDQTLANSCREVLHKYKEEIIVEFKYIKNDEKEITSLLTDKTTIDISTAKYLSAYLFEKALNNNLDVVYYDDEESQIKNYKTHSIITNKIFKLSIEDMVKLGGGNITKKMHSCVDINDNKTVNAVVGVVENNLNKYSNFINYIQRINSYINHRNINNLSYKLSDDLIKKIIYAEEYVKIKKYNLFSIEGNTLTFLNEDIKKMFSVSGAFLENYLYIKLIKSNQFDEVLMSSIIDFSTYYNKYPISCEIDCLVIKDNHLLFISCKSNKVDTDALNEIKLHSTIFGNDLSKPVICTIDDLNKTSPSEYLKAKELKIFVIDRTSFINNTIVGDLLKIVNSTYKYERV